MKIIKYSRRKAFIAKLSFLVLCINIPFVNAEAPYAKYTANDIRMLPPFCRYWISERKKGNSGAAKKKMQKKYDVSDLQHLCPGLNALNTSYKHKKNTQGHHSALQAAIGELSYVLKRHQKFSLRSTVLLKRGKAYEEKGEINQAMADYRQAIKIKSNNTYAYTSLARVYLKLNNKVEAQKVITEGLKIKPDSKSLRQWKKKLGM